MSQQGLGQVHLQLAPLKPSRWSLLQLACKAQDAGCLCRANTEVQLRNITCYCQHAYRNGRLCKETLLKPSLMAHSDVPTSSTADRHPFRVPLTASLSCRHVEELLDCAKEAGLPVQYQQWLQQVG